MCDKTDTLENNPFAYLFPNLEEARKYSREAAAKLGKREINLNGMSPESGPSSGNTDNGNQEVTHSLNGVNDQKEKPQKIKILNKEERINKIVEDVFGITLNRNTEMSLIWLEEFSTGPEAQLFNISNLEQILLERLLLEEPTKNLLNPPTGGVVDSHIVQAEVITYLLECQKMLSEILFIEKNEDIKDEIRKMQMLIWRNASTALRQTDLYAHQNTNLQVLQIFYENQDASSEEVTLFFTGIVNELLRDKEETPDIVLETFAPIFEFVYIKIASSNLHTFKHAVIFSFLQMMASNEHLAEALLDYSTPKAGSLGKEFSNTLLGSIFCLSCLPKVSGGHFEFFDSPNDMHASKTVENIIWTFLKCINDNLHQLFLALLKMSPEIKHKTLEWFADCLHSNAGRGQLANEDDRHELKRQYVSDGFMLNFSALLLKLCQPFITAYDTPKILKIDPTYCAAKITSREEAQRRHCHMHNLHSETCLLPLEDGEERPVSDTFNFVTECYFLAGKSLDLGFRVCSAQVDRSLREVTNLRKAYNDLVRDIGANHEFTREIEEAINACLQKYLSLRAAIIVPETLDLLTKLHATSSNWLIQLLLNVGDSNSSHILRTMKDLVIPLPEEIPITLKCVPEFVILNITYFMSFLRQINSEILQENGLEWCNPILSMIVPFMGSSKRLSNPHLRATLAESMEALLPINNNNNYNYNDDNDNMLQSSNTLETMFKMQLFKQHPFRKLIIPTLLNVFVSIEMTGQSVEFQEKFKYRRPMYKIMNYLWTVDEYRESFKDLAAEAERNMEAIPPPLFLRFLNLLINDAVFLLEEALSKMAELKKMQIARDSGKWEKLSYNDRYMNERAYQVLDMQAGFENILARWTIHTLEFLTSELKSIFWHITLVERVASMLNYFLHHLVGPNSKNFKVKNKNQYNFKPEKLVMDICKIYVHLYESDAFCLAVSQDGRSYNSELFRQAEDILARIGGGQLIGELQEVDRKVSLFASQLKEEEEMFPDPPEEFLDAIMSTLMTDPVILPISGQVVERATIARHLLSDQTDPFNRSPLTLDKVISHDELREKIEAWKTQHRKQSKESLKGNMSTAPSSSKTT